MFDNPRRLRRPEERVGQLANAALPPPVGSMKPDAELLLALRARDERAFEQLLDHYYSPMLRVATSFLRSREEAEEVIQDTWVAVLNGIDRFRGDASFKTWLFSILVNRARARAKREARSVAFSSIESPSRREPFEPREKLWPPAAKHDNPESRLLATEFWHVVAAAIAELPRDQRLVVTLRDIDGWNADEICAALMISPANQRVLLHRGRMKLRASLAPYADRI
jgi:RNA polymerase sigma-70 factor (ECF subfamily)